MGLLAVLACAPAWAGPVVALVVEADGIPAALTPVAGDPQRGRKIFESRAANCSLCHTIPGGGHLPGGNIGPPLAGVGQRLTEAQIRLRIVDPLRRNAESVMPSYYRVKGMTQVAPEYRGRPVLEPQQIEDVIAYLRTLQ